MMLLLLLACGRFDLDKDDDDEAHDAPAASGPREIVLDPAALSGAGIIVAPAEIGQLPRSLDLAGTIMLDPTAEARAGAPVGGTITRVYARPGDVVAAGATLATVRSTEVADARAAWSSADARRTSAQARRDRLKLLEADGVSSRAQVLDAEADLADAAGAADAAAQRLALYGLEPGGKGPDAPIRTPIARTLLEATASVGAFVTPDTPLFHVGDPDHLWLMLAVPDALLADVIVGQAATFTVDGVVRFVPVSPAGDPGAADHADADATGSPFTATVVTRGRWVDPTARTVNVRASVDDPGHQLRPNQFAHVTLVIDGTEAASGIVLPAEAVQNVDGHDVVFVEDKPGQFHAVPVTIAERVGVRVRLAAGVDAGQRVVVTGVFALKGELVKGEMGGDDD